MIKDEITLCMGCMSQLEDGSSECPVCGFSEDNPCDCDYLTPGTRLNDRYIAGKLLHKNAECAQYIGYDCEEEMRVWIIEFMPQSLCSRNQVSQAIKENKGTAAEYDTLKADFKDIHASLTGMVGEAAVPQLAIFEENNTVYIIYKFIQSITFAEYLSRNGGGISWSAAKKIFMPLFTSISNLHAVGIIHRGICPENILIDKNNKLWLFGFATQELRTNGGSLGGELYEGYCAPEQYDPGSWQGTWTDVYSIAAVLYKALTGTMPAASVSRKSQDNMINASELDNNIPKDVSEAISYAMILEAGQRIQTIDDFSAALLESLAGNTAVFSAEKLPKTKKPFFRRLAGSKKLPFGIRPGSTGAYVFITAMVTFIALVAVLIIIFFSVFMPMLGKNSKAENEQTSSEQQIETFKMPSFIGMYIKTVDENQEYATKFNFKTQAEYSDEYPEGFIFDQTPKADTDIPASVCDVTLIVSKGSEMVPMPNLEGSSYAFAVEALTKLGILYEPVPADDPNIAENIIVKTDKAVGESVRKYKDTIKLYVNGLEAEESASSSSSSNE